MNLNNGHLSDISDILQTFNGHFKESFVEIIMLNIEAKELEEQIVEKVAKIMRVK